MLMLTPAPVVETSQGYELDSKFLEGMKLQSSMWPGSFDCLMREGATEIPFGARPYQPETAGFQLHLISEHEEVRPEHLSGYDLIFCSADDKRNFSVPDLARSVGAKVATTLEYNLNTRLRIAFLDQDRNAIRRIYTAAKLVLQEFRRRKFLGKMDAIQANGYPAFEVCKKFDPNTLLFLDNRMTADLYATPEEMQHRRNRLLAGDPLQLVYTGRLEKMKGAHDLVPLALELRSLGVPFMLKIFGTGSLEGQIDNDIAQNNLSENVQRLEPLDFSSELVPYLRSNCDIYVCCHRQSDPSCTYIENMGCGLSVVGYGNEMWSDLQKDSRAGWVSPIGQVKKLAAVIAQIEKSRSDIAHRCELAAAFSKQNSFEALSRARMQHLEDLARSDTN
ncbi:glycosyltransferase [Ruegeria arenilitoris]|nr:glycosyltransferase [Ruegeria arenilitoris]